MPRLLLPLIVLFFSGIALAEDIEVNDPIEPFNRAIFWFNDKFDIYLLDPVSEGYDAVVPEPIQDSIVNFFANLRYPSYLVSDLVQLKFGQAASHTGRFLINTTLGIAGFFDVAEHMGLEEEVEEDFGLALAYHNVSPGPYLVLPILGPSNLRDAFGRLVDAFLDPAFYVSYTNLSDDAKLYIPLGLKAVQVVQTRTDLDEAIETAKESSLDYYLFVQGAYYQHRRGLLYDGNPPEDEDFAEETPQQGESKISDSDLAPKG